LTSILIAIFFIDYFFGTNDDLINFHLNWTNLVTRIKISSV